jgi:predicted small metal-binding protein
MKRAEFPIPSENEDMSPEVQAGPGMSFRCRDIGLDCRFEAHGSTRQEVMRKFINHAESAHGMQILEPNIILNIYNAITKYRF